MGGGGEEEGGEGCGLGTEPQTSPFAAAPRPWRGPCPGTMAASRGEKGTHEPHLRVLLFPLRDLSQTEPGPRRAGSSSSPGPRDARGGGWGRTFISEVLTDGNALSPLSLSFPLLLLLLIPGLPEFSTAVFHRRGGGGPGREVHPCPPEAAPLLPPSPPVPLRALPQCPSGAGNCCCCPRWAPHKEGAGSGACGSEPALRGALGSPKRAAGKPPRLAAVLLLLCSNSDVC